MNVARAHRIRDRVLALMQKSNQAGTARTAWLAVFEEFRAVRVTSDIELARLAMTIALDRGATIPEAAEVARAALKHAT